MINDIKSGCMCSAGYFLAPEGDSCSTNCSAFIGTVVSIVDERCIPVNDCALISLDRYHCVTVCDENQENDDGMCECADGFVLTYSGNICTFDGGSNINPNTILITGLVVACAAIICSVVLIIIYRE